VIIVRDGVELTPNHIMLPLPRGLRRTMPHVPVPKAKARRLNIAAPPDHDPDAAPSVPQAPAADPAPPMAELPRPAFKANPLRQDGRFVDYANTANSKARAKARPTPSAAKAPPQAAPNVFSKAKADMPILVEPVPLPLAKAAAELPPQAALIVNPMVPAAEPPAAPLPVDAEAPPPWRFPMMQGDELDDGPC
jgi:hypothetical protein